MSGSVARLTDRQFRSIAELVEGHVGIKLPPAKRLMLEGRLQKRVRALNQASVGEYAERLLDGEYLETELVHLIDCVTTNKTDFFANHRILIFFATWRSMSFWANGVAALKVLKSGVPPAQPAWKRTRRRSFSITC